MLVRWYFERIAVGIGGPGSRRRGGDEVIGSGRQTVHRLGNVERRAGATSARRDHITSHVPLVVSLCSIQREEGGGGGGRMDVGG